MALHRLSNRDDTRLIADCSVCGQNVPMRPTSRKRGTWRCVAQYDLGKRMSPSERPYTAYKKDYCEWHEGCDFKIVHSCQLAVDHIDGNHFNNDPGNLQTLCLGHNGLKTHLHGDYNKPKVAVI